MTFKMFSRSAGQRPIVIPAEVDQVFRFVVQIVFTPSCSAFISLILRICMFDFFKADASRLTVRLAYGPLYPS